MPNLLDLVQQYIAPGDIPSPQQIAERQYYQNLLSLNKRIAERLYGQGDAGDQARDLIAQSRPTISATPSRLEQTLSAVGRTIRGIMSPMDEETGLPNVGLAHVPGYMKVARKTIPLSEELLEQLKNTKAVTSEGLPQQMYHGTPVKFAEFDPSMARNSDVMYGGKGIWFTDSPAYANSYALDEIHDIPLHSQFKMKFNPAIYRAYINAERPFDFSGVADWRIPEDILKHGTFTMIDRGGKLRPAFVSESGRRFLGDGSAATTEELANQLMLESQYTRSNYPRSKNQDVIQSLPGGTGDDLFNTFSRLGYDSLKGVQEAGAREWAVFSPHQIIAPQRVPISRKEIWVP